MVGLQKKEAVFARKVNRTKIDVPGKPEHGEIMPNGRMK